MFWICRRICVSDDKVVSVSRATVLHPCPSVSFKPRQASKFTYLPSLAQAFALHLLDGGSRETSSLDGGAKLRTFLMGALDCVPNSLHRSHPLWSSLAHLHYVFFLVGPTNERFSCLEVAWKVELASN